MSRCFNPARALALLVLSVILTSCGGGGPTAPPSGQQLTGTLDIDIKPLRSNQSSPIIPIELSVPPTGALDPISVRIHVGYRFSVDASTPTSLMRSAEGSPDLNDSDFLLDIPPEGLEITFFWDALEDLGLDANFDTVVVRAGILAAAADDPRQAVCDFEPIISVSFGSGIACEAEAPIFNNTSLDDATIGEAYDVELETTGGILPLSFDVIDPLSGNPSGTPDLGFGLFLDSESGRITGTPIEGAPENFTFIARVVDSCDESASGAAAERGGSQTIGLPGGRFDQRQFTLTINGGIPNPCTDPAPVITTESIPAGAIGATYDTQLEFTGGQGSLDWAAVGLPTGLSVDATGRILGTPTEAGSFEILVTVSDSCSATQSDTATLTLAVACGSGPVFNTDGNLPDATFGSPYNQSFTVDMANGIGTVEDIDGSLPSGLEMATINTTGNQITVNISGTPDNSEQIGSDFVLNLQATDACPETALTAGLNVNITLVAPSACPEAAPQLETGTGNNELTPGIAGQPYSHTLVVTGGTLPVGAIEIISGAPAGLTIQTDGRTIAGAIPSDVLGVQAITFRVADSCSTPAARTDQETFLLNVGVSCTTLTITTTDLPNATNGVSYNTILQANGGFGTQSWALAPASGPLPTGLTISADGTILGTPAETPGIYPITVQVSDACPSGSQVVTRALTIEVDDPLCPAPTFVTTELLDPIFGTPYAATIDVTGGATPYTFDIAVGRLPTGLTLNPDGTIDGSLTDPSEIGVTFDLTVRVSDSCGPPAAVATEDFTVIPQPSGCAIPRIDTESVDNPIFQTPFDFPLAATGVDPFTWTLESGTLPSGLTLSSDGHIAGTPDLPTDVGVDFTFTVRATDLCIDGPQFDEATYTIRPGTTIVCEPIGITNTGFPDPLFLQNYKEPLTASGVAPFSWSLFEGDLPTGISVDELGGFITGTPNNPSEIDQVFTFTLRVVDSCELLPQSATAEFSFTLLNPVTCDPAVINTTELENPFLNAPYLATLDGTGEGSLTWTLESGLLPSGLTLNAVGTITGTPDESEEVGQPFEFTVRLTDSCAPTPQTITADLSFTLEDCEPVAINNTGFADPVINQAYSATLLGEGVAPFSWALVGGALPTGMGVNPIGLLEGTPTDSEEIGSTFDFILELTDSCPPGSNTITADYSFVLRAPTCPEVDITTEVVPNPFLAQSFGFQIEALGGQPPLSFSLASGSLPTGLTLGSGGFISGVATEISEVGTQFDFEVLVEDACPFSPTSDLQAFSVILEGPDCGDPPTITNTAFPDPIFGQAYNATLMADGGSPPFTWGLNDGNLPEGMTVDSDGTLTGTPTNIEEIDETFDFTLHVDDACFTGSRRELGNFSFTLREPECDPVSITTEVLPAPEWNVFYRELIVATGGTGDYTFTLTDGLLPEGLILAADGALAGTPTNGSEIGDLFDFEVTVEDTCLFGPATDARRFQFVLAGPTCAPDLTILNEVFGDPVIDLPYAQELLASGGEQPYSWRLVDGSLPFGMSVNAGGSLEGTPTDAEEVGSQFDFTLEVADDCILGSQTVTADFSFTLQPGCPPISIDQTSLPDPFLDSDYSEQLTATGGVLPLTWSLALGSLPDGLQFGSDGRISGVANNPDQVDQPFTFLVQVEDACPQGPQTTTRSFQITLRSCPELFISNTGFTNPVFGELYDATLNSSGGFGTISWALGIDSNLPDGLTVTADGHLVGTPNNPSQVDQLFTFTLEVSDTCPVGPGFDSREFSFVLTAPACAAPVFITDELPAATFLTPYGAQIDVSGTGPFTFGTTGSGALPDGLTLNSDGSIDGQPTNIQQIDQEWEFEVIVTDSCPFAPNQESRFYSIFVNPFNCNGPVNITNTGFPNPILGQDYNAALQAQGGLEPYEWSLIDSSLPTGMSVNSDGFLEGTPTNPQQAGQLFTFNIQVEDACPNGVQSDIREFSFVLLLPDCGDVVIDTPRVDDPEWGVPYDQAIEVSGGQPAYHYSLGPNSFLPTGITLDQDTGHLIGTPTNGQQVGTEFSFTVNVSDECPFNPGMATMDYLITLTGPDCAPPLTITNTGFPDPVVGQEYNATLMASGGFPPLTWELAGLNLPTGMFIDPDGFLAGTPTVPGEAGGWEFNVGVTDECPLGQQSDVKQFDFTLQLPNCGTVTMNTPTLPDPVYGVPYDQPINVTGGQPPYTFSLGPNSQLPIGMSLNTSTGHIEGTPTSPDQIGSRFFFDVTATDECPLNPGSDTVSYQFILQAPDCPELGIQFDVLPDPVFGEEYFYQFQSVGGFPPINWTLEPTAGPLPIGLILNLDGTITGTPTSANQIGGQFNFAVRATDSCPTGQQSGFSNFGFTLRAPNCPELGIVNQGIPDPVFGSPYSFQMESVGGVPPISWELSPNGGPLPIGLSMSSDGLISGTPTEAREIGSGFLFIVVATDDCALPQSGFSEFQFTLQPPNCGEPVDILNMSFPNPVLNQEYNVALLGSGGVRPYKWALAPQVFLPEGMSVNEIGFLEGTPTNPQQVDQNFQFVLRMEDSCVIPQVTFAEFEFTLQREGGCSELSIQTDVLPDALVNRDYNTALVAAGGVAPFFWDLAPGPAGLPQGLAIDPTGAIVGKPTNPNQAGQTFNLTLRVTDSCDPPQVATRALQLSLEQPPCGNIPVITTTPTNLPPANFGKEYSFIFAAAGGRLPYRWSGDGTLPDGLTFDVGGKISGTPTNQSQIGTQFTVRVRVVDDCEIPSGVISFTLVLNP